MLFRSEEKRRDLFLDFSGSKRNTQTMLKFLKIEKKEQSFSDTFHDKKVTNQIPEN